MAFILVILTIPSNLYKLPVGLPFDLEIYRIIVMIILTSWVISMLIDSRSQWRRTPLDFALAWLMSAIFLSLLVNLTSLGASELGAAIKAVALFSTFVLVYYFVVTSFRAPGDIESILRFVVVIGGLISVFGIVERATSYNFFHHLHQWIPFLQSAGEIEPMVRGGLRVAGPAVHPIAFSALLAMIVPLAIYFSLNSAKLADRRVFTGLSALIVIALALTESRTGFVALGAVGAVLMAGFRKNRQLLLGGSLAMLFMVHMVFPGVLGTIRATLSPEYIIANEIGNEAGRIEDYSKIWAEVVRRPLFGLGYYAFTPQKYFFLDNQYLKFAVEIGLFGLAAVVWLFWRLFGRLWRAQAHFPGDNPLFVAIAASGVAFMVASATFDTFGFSQTPYLFFIVSALGMAHLLNLQEARS